MSDQIPILRCGPWGHVGGGTDAFANYLTEGTYPVNCAKTDWKDASWKALWVRSTQLPLDDNIATTGFCSLGESVEVVRATAFVIMNFCYQANEDFNIGISWSVQVPDDVKDQVFPSLAWNTYTLDGQDEAGSETVEFSGGKSVTCHATPLGRFRVRVDAVTPFPPPRPRREASLVVSIS